MSIDNGLLLVEMRRLVAKCSPLLPLGLSGYDRVRAVLLLLLFWLHVVGVGGGGARGGIIIVVEL